MNRAAAWSVRGVGRETRDAAQEAARRAGMSLGEWLDEVIADQAAEQGVDPQDFDEEDKLDAISDRLSSLSRRRERAPREERASDMREDYRPRRWPPQEDGRRADELLDAAISRFESRAAKSDARTARALDSVASLIERNQSGRRDERETLRAVMGRLESLEERLIRQQAERDAAAARQAEREAAAARQAEREAAERRRAEREEARRQAERQAAREQAEREAAERRRAEREAAAKEEAEREAAATRLAEREAAARAQAEREFAAREQMARAEAERELVAKEQAAREAMRRAETAREPQDLALRAAPDQAPAAPRVRPRVDIDNAVAEIARRRQELDARAASATAAAPSEPAKRGWRNFGVETPTPRVEPQAPRAPVASPAPQVMTDALQGEIRKLSQRLEELRRDQAQAPAAPSADIEGLRGELAAMSRSLAELAPRNAVVALEGAIRDLSQRVAASRENGARETLLAPVEGLVAGLSESLRAHDPREAVESLRRELGAIAAKVDGIGSAAIDPAALELIRKQVEETRGLLGALAKQAAPLDRLERQIGALADRVEQLSTNPAPSATSWAPVVAELAKARAQVEGSTSGAALSAIEQRLEQIAARMDKALENPLPARLVSPRAFEDLSRRIDSVRESIESHYASAAASAAVPAAVPAAPDVSVLEQTMREISAKLDRPIQASVDPQAFESQFQDLGERIDRRPASTIDTAPLEQILRKLAERPSVADTRPLEGLIREVGAKLDRPAPPVIEVANFERMIHDLGERISQQRDPVVDTRFFEDSLRHLHEKIDQSAAPHLAVERIDQAVEALSAQIAAKTASVDMHALEGMVGELLHQLDETRHTLHELAAAPQRSAGNDDAFVRGLDDLRIEQGNADRRIQSALGGVHDMLEALVDRIGQIEDEVAQVSRPPAVAPEPAPAAASYAPRDPAPAASALNSMDSTIRSAPVFAPPARTAPAEVELRAPQLAPAGTPMRSIDGSEFLMEPGSGAPLRASPADSIASEPPKSTINAHIAAARRAAQAALAETANNMDKTGGKSAPRKAQGPGGVAGAKAFLTARRRPILLGVALVALLTIAFVELGVLRQPSMQKSESPPIAAPKQSSLEPAKEAPAAPAPQPHADARGVDLAPVGSIAPAPAHAPTTKFLSPAPAELVATIPPGVPQGLREAAAAGDPSAQFELAARLAEGRSIVKDPHAASLWFERAAAQNFAPAEYRLGSLYEKGLGVARDPQLAMAWYKKAADAGNARAMHNLAVLIAGNASVKPDYAQAADWFTKAAQLGVKDSQYNLAILYARGMGVTQDLGQSWIYFSLAAQQGDADAAKKRDEVAAKMDAKAIAVAGAALANFHAATPNPAANDAPPPPGGWDVGKIGAPAAVALPPSAAGARI